MAKIEVSLMVLGIGSSSREKVSVDFLRSFRSFRVVDRDILRRTVYKFYAG